MEDKKFVWCGKCSVPTDHKVVVKTIDEKTIQVWVCKICQRERQPLNK